jgi:hypothetical protein
MVPQPLATVRNRSYPNFWEVTDDPRCLVYKTLTVALEPFVVWVARAIHSMGGIIGTHVAVGFDGEAVGLKTPWS